MATQDADTTGYDCTKPGRNRVDEARRATHDLCRLAQSFSDTAREHAEAQTLPAAERRQAIDELHDDARLVYGQWEPALVRARRAIQAIREVAPGWGIDLGPADEAIILLRDAIDKPRCLTHGQQPGDHLFRPMNALGFRRGIGPTLKFERMAEAIGVLAKLSNALRGVDEAGLDGGETGNQNKDKVDTKSDRLKDFRQVSWYQNATKGALSGYQLRDARNKGKLPSSKKPPDSGRWYYSVGEVIKLYPQHESLILQAIRKDSNVVV